MIDAKQKWIGGTARLVQTGDILDRGADVRAAIDLLMRLEGEARRAGGRVDVLFGNHEGMNVLHDFRDVSRQPMSRFADARSDDRLQKAFDSHAAIAKRAGATLNRDEWMKTHPRGSSEYVEAFGPSGTYGRWMRARKAVLQIGDTIFMHAGLQPGTHDHDRRSQPHGRTGGARLGRSRRPRSSAPGAPAPTSRSRRSSTPRRSRSARSRSPRRPASRSRNTSRPTSSGRLQFLMKFEKLTLIEADGPLWYRGLATMPEDQQPAVDALLRRHGARRIVLGHTPQLPAARIRTRFGGLVALIDTGMLTSYFKGGQPSALEIQEGR